MSRCTRRLRGVRNGADIGWNLNMARELYTGHILLRTTGPGPGTGTAGGCILDTAVLLDF